MLRANSIVSQLMESVLGPLKKLLPNDGHPRVSRNKLHQLGGIFGDIRDATRADCGPIITKNIGSLRYPPRDGVSELRQLQTRRGTAAAGQPILKVEWQCLDVCLLHNTVVTAPDNTERAAERP